MFFTIFGLAILAALFATFDGGADPAGASSPAAGDPGAGSGSPAGGDGSGVGTAPTDPASGGVTPAGSEFADLDAMFGDDPRKGAFLGRLNDLSAKHREAQQQLSQFTEVQDFIPLVKGLRQAGFTPDQVTQYLNQPPAAPQAPADPQAELDQWLERQGIDPYALDPVQQRIAQMQFQQEQRWQQFEAHQSQQRVQAAEAELTTEMQRATQQFPALQEPAFQQAVYGQWGTLAEAALAAGRPAPTLLQVAGQFHTAMEAYKSSELARYAAGKQADGVVPVAVGGSAPPPVSTQNFHEASAEQRRAMIDSHLSAINGSA